MCFVIVQHLSIDHDSNLAIILQRATKLDVSFLTKDTRPKAKHIYLRPPDKEVTVDNGILKLSERLKNNDKAYLPIDHFLFSLAADQKSYAIAVILSGMGSDGSRGVKSIKEQGGIALVQSPESAQFSGMPTSAIRFEVADFIGTAEEIAKTITAIDQRESTPDKTGVFKEMEQPGFERFLREIVVLIESKFRLDFSRYRISTIRRRIEKRLLIHMIDLPDNYLDMLRSDEEELRTLAQSFLIGVTRFFRDKDAFKMLEEQVIPQLAANAKEGLPIRVWVPACSTGEEAYSIAMMVDHYLSEHHPRLEFKILASDLDAKAIQIAGEGYFQDNIAADVPEKYLSKYFINSFGGYRIVPRLREKILFAVQNLLTDPPFIHIDLITCRNFLIYVDVEAQMDVIANFHFALSPDGFLMLGPSESLGRLQRNFTTINRRWKIFGRQAGTPHINSRKSRPSPTPSYLGSPVNQESSFIPAKSNDEFRMSNYDQFAQYLSNQFAPASLFVNQEYEIKYINGDLSEFFHFPRNHARFTLDKVLDKEMSILFRAAIDTIFSDSEENQENEITLDSVSKNGENYQAFLQEVVLEDAIERLVMIQIDRLKINESPEGKRTSLQADQLLKRRLHTLEEKLILSEQRARKLLNELEATNEELQTSNRELLASNEEMQSTNEELQSVNEELHTVNQEMQYKNEQLKTLNNDINRLLESTEIGTIFLDKDLIIRRFTPSIHHQFDLKESDISRPLTAFSSSFNDLGLADKCLQVLDTMDRYEEEIVDRQGRSFLLRILPHKNFTVDDTGLILSFIDINDLVDARSQLGEMALKYEVLMSNLDYTIAVVDSRGNIKELNDWISDDESSEKLIGQYAVDLIESDSEQVRFHNMLRKTFDKSLPLRADFQIKSDDKAPLHAEINFIPSRNVVDDDQSIEPFAILIVRDITKTVIERNNTQNLLEQYKIKIEDANNQGGLMDMKGNIIDMNFTRLPDMTTKDFIQQNVYDFLSDSGAKKIDEAYAKLRNGSFFERVHSSSDDLTIPSKPNGVVVTYEPIIANGEVVFVKVSEVNE